MAGSPAVTGPGPQLLHTEALGVPMMSLEALAVAHTCRLPPPRPGHSPRPDHGPELPRGLLGALLIRLTLPSWPRGGTRPSAVGTVAQGREAPCPRSQDQDRDERVLHLVGPAGRWLAARMKITWPRSEPRASAASVWLTA